MFSMRISNCVHNVALLDDAELLYEYEETDSKNGQPEKKGFFDKMTGKKGPIKQARNRLPYKSSSYALAPRVRQ